MIHNWILRLRHVSFSLQQHKLRTLLSTLGIACGVVSFLFMMSMGEGARRETLEQVEQLGM
ncbi:MAG: ABC transporter permease, partial [Bdellovibrionota bacterium]